MERKWTHEQDCAITARGGTLVVSAAAGSGKTAVLVERVIGLITDSAHPCDADRLLVVTFTNAAAAEMRERISQRLADMIEQNPLDTNLQRQQMLLQNAHISTIHSFCLELLREYFERLDIPPDFRIADQNEVEILRADVLDELLENRYASEISEKPGEKSAFLELSRILSSGRGDSLLADTVLRLYEFTRSLADSDGWLRQMEKMYEGGTPLKETVWGKASAEYILNVLDGLIYEHRRALSKINACEPMQKAYAPAFQSDLAGFESVKKTAQNGTWDELRDIVSGFVFEKLGQLRKFEDEALKDEIKKERDSAKKTLAGLCGGVLCCSEAEFKEDLEKLRPVVVSLCGLVKELDERFFAAKLSRSMLDFSDLEQLALKLLVKKQDGALKFTETAAEVSGRFEEILVDEYQDTNPAQDMIFRAVSRDGKNLFMVGDVKQSIYSFRQARPEIFTGKIKKCTPYDDGAFPAKIILGRNFRSRAGVTEAVNFIFSRLMSQKLGGVDYGKDDALIPAAEYFERDGADFAVHIVDAENFDGDEENAELEARHIAREIKKLVSSHFKVRGDNGPRDASWRDFCILLRSMTHHAEKYSRALEDEGVPVFADIASGYLGAYEVMVTVSLLRILDNPLQDVPLTSVLLSPVFGFTPDDVASIRINKRRGSLYLAMLEMSKNGDCRFDDFIKMLSRFRALAAVLPADRLILRIYDETGLLNIFEAMKNGSLRRANLRLLLDYARAYESAGWRGLSGFIRFIDRVDRQRSDLAPASVISENADVVRIMSIHKSKGLEFPVCFLAGLSKKFNAEDLQKPALFHPSCGFGSIIRDSELNCRFTTLPREAVKLETQKSSLSEELRVLYVAMTRAKEKLYAVMTLKKPENTLRRSAAIGAGGGKVSPYAALSAQNPAELILAAALSHPSCGALRKVAGTSENISAQTCRKWEVSLIPAKELMPQSIAAEQKKQYEIDASQIESIKTEIKKRLENNYPYKVLSGLPTKVSVSELTHGEPSAFNAEHIRPSFLSDEGLSPAEKGTALHAFMQYCRFDAIAAGGVDAEIGRLVKEKFLLPEQGEAVDAKKVAAFAASPIFTRILTAKKLWREFRFNIEVPASEIYSEAAGIDDKILLQGMADLVFEEENGVVLLDYKTDRVSSGDTLVQRYSGQLDYYARAVNNILEKAVKEKYIYSFALNDFIKI